MVVVAVELIVGATAIVSGGAVAGLLLRRSRGDVSITEWHQLQVVVTGDVAVVVFAGSPWRDRLQIGFRVAAAAQQLAPAASLARPAAVFTSRVVYFRRSAAVHDARPVLVCRHVVLLQRQLEPLRCKVV